MKNYSHIPTWVFLLILMFLGWIFSTNFTNNQVQTFAAEENKTDIRKWEYCSLISANIVKTNMGKMTGTATIYYLQNGNNKTEKVEATVQDNLGNIDSAKSSALAKAIAKLGSEGWEMVGEGTLFPYSSSEQKMLYFKRLIQ